jgi:uncharacterized membrane protein YeaQ/YmgE (transglycosylase-associated protein family)
MSAPVFISYSSKDEEAAETICAELESRQLNCWIAVRDVNPGDNFQEAVVRAIRAAKVMVLVFTKNANNSDEIKNEVALASQHQLVVIPVRVDDVAPNDALAYALATRQWIDLFRDWKRAIDRLGSRIAAIVSIESAADMTAQTAPVTRAPDPPTTAEQNTAAKPTIHDQQRRLATNAELPHAGVIYQSGTARPAPTPRGSGLIYNMIVGIVGAVIAGWLLPQIGIVIGAGIIAAIINAFIGAVILLLILRLIKRA